MPLYEYRCRRCGADFERIVRWDASPRDITCPECGAAEPERRVSLPASVRVGASAGGWSGAASSCSTGGG